MLILLEESLHYTPPHLVDLIQFTKDKGFKTSIITNGLMLLENNALLKNLLSVLECFGISIDSLDDNLNKKIGRSYKNRVLSFQDLQIIYKMVKTFPNVSFKINTVVSKFNLEDDSLFQIFDSNLRVDRWKMMMVCQSTYHSLNDFTINQEQYKKFVQKFETHPKCSIVHLEKEGENAMLHSYIMIDGDGNMTCDTTSINAPKINIFKNANKDIKDFIVKELNVERYSDRYKGGVNH